MGEPSLQAQNMPEWHGEDISSFVVTFTGRWSHLNVLVDLHSRSYGLDAEQYDNVDPESSPLRNPWHDEDTSLKPKAWDCLVPEVQIRVASQVIDGQLH